MFYLCRPDEGYSLSIILILYSDIQTHENTISVVRTSAYARVFNVYSSFHKPHHVILLRASVGAPE